jgi:phage shock protein PspC (stress-responsive transcriptional regulator)
MNDRLYRSRDDRMIAGVAGGLAEYWGADPSLIRILWAILILPTGFVALVVYIVMALVVPEDPLGYARPALGAAPPAGAPGVPDAAGEVQAQRAMQLAGEREARREARRMARAARRGDGGRNVALFFGALLILAGVWFLIDQYMPSFDTDWFWPLALVALGVVVLVMAVRPGTAPPPTESETSAMWGGDDAGGPAAPSGEGT